MRHTCLGHGTADTLQRLTTVGSGNRGALAWLGRSLRLAGCRMESVVFTTVDRLHYVADVLFVGTRAALNKDFSSMPMGAATPVGAIRHRPLQSHLPTFEVVGLRSPHLLETIGLLCDDHSIDLAHLAGRRTLLPPADYEDGWEMVLVLDHQGRHRRFRLFQKALIESCDELGLVVTPINRLPRRGDDGPLGTPAWPRSPMQGPRANVAVPPPAP